MRGGAEWRGRVRQAGWWGRGRPGDGRFLWGWVSLVVMCGFAHLAFAQDGSGQKAGAASFADSAPQASSGATGVGDARKAAGERPSGQPATVQTGRESGSKGSESGRTQSAGAASTATDPSAMPTTAATPGAQPGGPDASTYRVRLRDLERRIEELKEQIRRSHTRLSLLSDHIMSGVDSGGRVDVQFDNDLSDAWRIVELVVVLDGIVQYKKADNTGALSAQKLIPIFNGSLGKGDHVVQVMMKLRGHGFGLFSYLRGLDATVRNDYSFSLSRGKATEIRVTAWEQGGPTTSAEERPNIRFNEMSAGGRTPAPRAVEEAPANPE